MTGCGFDYYFQKKQIVDSATLEERLGEYEMRQHHHHHQQQLHASAIPNEAILLNNETFLPSVNVLPLALNLLSCFLFTLNYGGGSQQHVLYALVFSVWTNHNYKIPMLAAAVFMILVNAVLAWSIHNMDVNTVQESWTFYAGDCLTGK